MSQSNEMGESNTFEPLELAFPQLLEWITATSAKMKKPQLWGSDADLVLDDDADHSYSYVISHDIRNDAPDGTLLYHVRRL